MYVMNKNQKPLSLKVPDKAERILEKYKANKKQNNGYVFPFLANANQKDPKDIFMKSRNASRLFNKYLKIYPIILLVILLEILQEIRFIH